jgi:hypothetical protein
MNGGLGFVSYSFSSLPESGKVSLTNETGHVESECEYAFTNSPCSYAATGYVSTNVVATSKPWKNFGTNFTWICIYGGDGTESAVNLPEQGVTYPQNFALSGIVLSPSSEPFPYATVACDFDYSGETFDEETLSSSTVNTGAFSFAESIDNGENVVRGITVSASAFGYSETVTNISELLLNQTNNIGSLTLRPGLAFDDFFGLDFKPYWRITGNSNFLWEHSDEDGPDGQPGIALVPQNTGSVDSKTSMVIKNIMKSASNSIIKVSFDYEKYYYSSSFKIKSREVSR